MFYSTFSGLKGTRIVFRWSRHVLDIARTQTELFHYQNKNHLFVFVISRRWKSMYFFLFIRLNFILALTTYCNANLLCLAAMISC